MRRGCGARQGREREREQQQQQQQLQQLLQCSVIGVARHDIFSRLQKRVSYWGQLVSSSSLVVKLVSLEILHNWDYFCLPNLFLVYGVTNGFHIQFSDILQEYRIYKLLVKR
ncbi:hypothetical protein H0E87_014646 [Populus deltoides]|uniref:Uncharacterized protein n=1 Tax=Populus deltoides TaxID=3696 RepID=A0A8T2YEI4_POPDE|nr:hypothetical protein H0E87_014646 [Populus deltoides]